VVQAGRYGSYDADSSRWLLELRDRGPVGDRAVERLHAQLLRMAYSRLLSSQPPLQRGEVDDAASDAAGDAVVAVLAHLDEFRGASRFTTWACQFALTEVSAGMRRRRRRMPEVLTEPGAIDAIACPQGGTERAVEEAELLRCVCTAVNDLLTERQRIVLLALAIDGESPAETAGRLDSTVGALYKNVHDARRTLRAHLLSRGFLAG